MRVNEIFNSIDGEGLRTGELATFIRLSGCNLRCRYCDTCYALKMNQGIEMSINDILNEVKKYNVRNITLTGGEPLLQKDSFDLIDTLINNNFNVNIETNGAVSIKPLINKNVLITMDYKSISSGMNNKMLLDNLELLRETDVLKFVVNKNDLEDVKNILKKYRIKSYIYLSPIFNEIEPSELVEFLKDLNNEIDTSKIRVQIQLHKIIWNPEKRGV